jgi:DNA polymerase III subunit beta
MEKRFKLNRAMMVNAINIAGQLAGTSNVVAIAKCVRLTFNKNTLVIRSTDTASTLRMVVDLGYDVPEKTDICVEKELLMRTLRVISDEEITMLYDAERNTVSVVYGRGYIDMPTFDAATFPSMPMSGESKVFNMPSSVLAEFIADGRNFIYTEKTEAVFNSIAIIVEGNTVTCYSTNRAVVYKNQFTLPESYGEKMCIMLPSNTFKPILDMCAQGEIVQLSIRQQNVVVSCGTLSYCARLTDGIYPDVERLMELPRTQNMSLSLYDIKEAMKRMSVTVGASGLVVMDIKPESLMLTGGDIMLQKNCKEELICQSSKEDRIGINTSFLDKAINCVKTASLVVRYESADKVVSVESADSPYPLVIIAPMRIAQPAAEQPSDEASEANQ